MLPAAMFEGVSSHTSNPDFKRKLAATLTQNMMPSSPRARPFKPAETQRDADSSASSLHSHHVSDASTDASRIYYNRLESTTNLKPETQVSDAPSFPKGHQRMKLPLTQQRFTDRDDAMKNIISAKPPKRPEMQNYMRTCGPQTQVLRESTDPSVPKKRLPDVLILGSPPPKPQRPPSVDLNRFRGSLTNINDGGPGLKIPLSVAPPRRLSCPSFNHPDLYLNQGEVIHNTDDYVKTVNTGLDDLKGEEEDEAGLIVYQSEAEADLYDEIGTPADVCSGLNVQNIEEEDVYVEMDDPDTRVSSLPQPNPDEDDIYDYVAYDDIKEGPFW